MRMEMARVVGSAGETEEGLVGEDGEDLVSVCASIEGGERMECVCVCVGSEGDEEGEGGRRRGGFGRRGGRGFGGRGFGRL